MRIKNDNLELSGADLTSNLTSSPIHLSHVANYSVQVVFSGTAITGTFKLQGSNDKGANADAIADASIQNWTDLAGSSEAVTASGDILWNAQNIGYKWVRLVWTDAGTTSGTISGTYTTKGI